MAGAPGLAQLAVAGRSPCPVASSEQVKGEQEREQESGELLALFQKCFYSLFNMHCSNTCQSFNSEISEYFLQQFWPEIVRIVSLQLNLRRTHPAAVSP